MANGVRLTPASLLTDEPNDRRIWERFSTNRKVYCRTIGLLNDSTA